uniref:Beta-carotene ketolase n=1 Tax=Coelastrella oocystiformis TaxID=75804 RepID=G3F5K3_9CHLO|nr:beta-carotene ketolase [Coelastrella oocystiformis]
MGRGGQSQLQPQQTFTAPQTSGPDGKAASVDVIELWKAQYPLPDEDVAGSFNEVKQLYRPPHNDAKGVSIAVGLIVAWCLLFYHGCWQIKLTGTQRSWWIDIAGTFLMLEFVNTGLFITTHDAMHGTICYRNRKLNDVLGRIAITLYAWFDYDMLHKKHWEHHGHTGQPGKDPDFHRGNPALPVWYARFMWEYSTPLQFAKIILASQVLQAAGVPYANLCIFMAAAPLVAAFRLFYYGTYLPHLPPDAKEIMVWQKSHSSDAPRWLSFLKCYHFDYHWEHHRWPFAPWWELPKAKEIVQQQRSQKQLLQ